MLSPQFLQTPFTLIYRTVDFYSYYVYLKPIMYSFGIHYKNKSFYIRLDFPFGTCLQKENVS